MICLKYILKDLKENVATSLFERSAVTLTNKGVFNKAESKTARLQCDHQLLLAVTSCDMLSDKGNANSSESKMVLNLNLKYDS